MFVLILYNCCFLIRLINFLLPVLLSTLLFYCDLPVLLSLLLLVITVKVKKTGALEIRKIRFLH